MFIFVHLVNLETQGLIKKRFSYLVSVIIPPQLKFERDNFI